MRQLPKYLFLTVSFATLVFCLLAQDGKGQTNATRWLMQEYSVKSLKEMTPVFLNLPDFETIGETNISGDMTSGGFHRAQQPEDKYRLKFNSHRYQQLKNARLYGGFSFTQEWDQKVTLTESLDPYRGNPYMAGDSLMGNWKKQWYGLRLDISSAPLVNDRLFLGAALNYVVGTGARQEDPRPMSLSKDLNIDPAVLWKIDNHHHVGIKGVFGFFNEDITMEVKNPNETHYLYKMAGPVDVFDVQRLTYASVFNRSYNGNTYGTGLQYAYSKDGLLAAVSGTYQKRIENVRDGITNPLKAGQLNEIAYKTSAVVQKGSVSSINKVEIQWNQFDREGTEFHQRLSSVDQHSSQLYETIFQGVFTTALQTDAMLEYSYLHLAENATPDWMLSAAIGFHGYDSRYLYPQNKQIADVMRYNLNLGRNWDNGKSGFMFKVGVGFQQKITAESDLAPPEGSAYVIDHLLLPDQAYLTANWVQPLFSATYSNRLNAKTSWYIGANGDFTLKGSSNDLYMPKGSRERFQLTFGIVY